MELIYPKAVLSPASDANIGGALISSNVRLFVVHVMQGTLDGTASWFKNPQAQVSAHFGVGKNGTVLQFVPLDRVAWAEESYNDAAISVEHEGYSGETLTKRQLAASISLLSWLHTQFPHVPLVRTANPQGVGVIAHGELGVSGGDHPDCPGNPIIDQFNVALRTSFLKDPSSKKTKTKKPLIQFKKG